MIDIQGYIKIEADIPGEDFVLNYLDIVSDPWLLNREIVADIQGNGEYQTIDKLAGINMRLKAKDYPLYRITVDVYINDLQWSRLNKAIKKQKKQFSEFLIGKTILSKTFLEYYNENLRGNYTRCIIEDMKVKDATVIKGKWKRLVTLKIIELEVS